MTRFLLSILTATVAVSAGTAFAAGPVAKPAAPVFEGDNGEIADIQAEQAKGYAQLYNQLKNAADDQERNTAIQNAGTYFGDSGKKMDDLLRARAQQADAELAPRVFLPSGSSMSLEKFNAMGGAATLIPSGGSKSGNTAVAGGTAPGAPQQANGVRAPSSASPVSPSTTAPIPSSDSSSKNLRPEFVLDGSKIPKEIHFERKKPEVAVKKPQSQPENRKPVLNSN